MDLFGPLDKKYCTLFLAYAIFGLIGCVLIVVSSVVAIYHKKESALKILVGGGSMLLVYLALYFQGRLTYQMCLAR